MTEHHHAHPQEKPMNKPSDEDVKEMVFALLEGGDPKAEFGVNGLRLFCRSAARMIKDLRPDLSYEEHNHT
jgi:hypothetical protein